MHRSRGPGWEIKWLVDIGWLSTNAWQVVFDNLMDLVNTSAYIRKIGSDFCIYFQVLNWAHARNFWLPTFFFSYSSRFVAFRGWKKKMCCSIGHIIHVLYRLLSFSYFQKPIEFLVQSLLSGICRLWDRSLHILTVSKSWPTSWCHLRSLHLMLQKE